MIIPWGKDVGNSVPVQWEAENMVNPHIGLFADTGMGKTYTIRRLIAAILASTEHRVRFHIFDPHGDIEIDGESAVRFHESADFGFNPLELNADPEFGGIRKRIQSLITAINKTSSKIGARQERALTRLLTALYRDRGFTNDHTTWGLCPERPSYPGLEEAIEYGRSMLKAMFIGSKNDSVIAFQELAKLSRQLRQKEIDLLKNGESDTEVKGRLQDEIEALKKRAIALYTDAINSLETGDELDEAMEADGVDEIMKSVIDRLENLYAIGIYRSTPPPLESRCPVWRYIITSLEADEKKLFTMTRLETIFTRAVQRGPQSRILDVIVLDEAHLFQDKAEDYIINRMVRESRKFGVMMIFASQGLNDFPDALLASLGTKIVLGIDRTYRRTAQTKFGLSDEQLNFIIPMRRILVQMKKRGQINSSTHKVMLND